MPANTSTGLPYPLPTDPVRAGATDIKALADALELRGGGFKFIAGKVATATDAQGFAQVTFPGAGFSAAYLAVLLTNANPYSEASLVFSVDETTVPPSATRFGIRAWNNRAGAWFTGAVTVSYWAFGRA
jgi:deoxyribose-phosphate aldolase